MRRSEGEARIQSKKIEGTWVEKCLAAPAKRDAGLAVLAQLELLAAWTKGGRGAWPGAEVSDRVRGVEQDIAREADKLLEKFGGRLSEPLKVTPAAEARREEFLADTFAEARALRDELTAMLAVYVERDPTHVGTPNEKSLPEPIRDNRLRELLRNTDLPNLAGTGPELGVLMCILFALPLYAIFAWKELHPLLSAPGAASSSLTAVLATAGMEGLRLLAIFWFPLLTAFAVRQHYYDGGHGSRGRTMTARATPSSALPSSGWPSSSRFVCLSGVAVLWAFFIAKDVSSFQGLLVGGDILSPLLRVDGGRGPSAGLAHPGAQPTPGPTASRQSSSAW